MIAFANNRSSVPKDYSERRLWVVWLSAVGTALDTLLVILLSVIFMRIAVFIDSSKWLTWLLVAAAVVCLLLSIILDQAAKKQERLKE
ncbi:MAG: hypothetical protein U1C49_02630 [Candidatus Andersenbacteria bacterium]|nr:hypothetical protein [bacterium]MDZ4225723.1 hypothetical protein [Candidatus Andersenbacteria bacterium]